MTTTKTVYECDTCKARHDNFHDARECERLHAKVRVIACDDCNQSAAGYCPRHQPQIREG